MFTLTALKYFLLKLFFFSVKIPCLCVIHHNLFLVFLVTEMELLRLTSSLNWLYKFSQPPLRLSLLLLSSHLLFTFSSDLSFPADVTRCTNDKSTGLSVCCAFYVFAFMLSLIYYCEFCLTFLNNATYLNKSQCFFPEHSPPL